MEPAISVREVAQAFGEGERRMQALSPVSLDIQPGEFVCFIGPSGCGKTSLLNIIGGLGRAASGQVSVMGAQVQGAPRPKDIGFVFQENALFPWKTIAANIDLALRFAGVPKTERAGRVAETLEAVGLTAFAQHHPSELSGGMKQRAQLARALALDTPILLMDEPFAALDEQTRMILGEDLSALLARRGKTIVFVTHSLGEAVYLADRIVVFTARPGAIKEVVEVNEPHPRDPAFAQSEKFGRLRAHLFAALHDEIRQTLAGQA